MAGLTDLLNLSGTGLQAYQSQINTYSNNIANVNTAGYSRRTVGLEALASDNGLGQGVRAGTVTRMYNTMGRTALLQEESSTSYHTALAAHLSDIEMLMGGGQGGVDDSLVEFNNALQDAIASPEDIAARTTLLQRASALASKINTIDSKLTDLETLYGSAQSILNEVNAITDQLQELNQEITKADAMGKPVPELLDKRDQLVRELATKVNVSVSADYRITIGGQQVLSANGQIHADLVHGGSSSAFAVNGVAAPVTGGELAALEKAQSVFRTLNGNLDTLASTLASETNAIFNGAYNLQGERPADLGYSFFVGTSAGDIAVDATLYNATNPMGARPELVALAATRASAGPPPIPNSGDNTAGQNLFNMLQDSQAGLGGSSISSYWNLEESKLAGAVQQARQDAAIGQMTVKMLEGEMLSVSGVNLDEELLNLMGAQKAYEACARVMSTASNMLDTLINLGR